VKPDAKKIVVLSLIATGTVVVLHAVVKQHEFPSPRIFIGGAIMFVILGFVAEFAPQVAAPFAVLVFLAVLLTDGGTALEATTAAITSGRKVGKKR
jgi:membrane-associated HD superfamily phosphohydrolase